MQDYYFCSYLPEPTAALTWSHRYRLESSEDVSKVLENNRALQEENNKLSRELSEAVGQTAFMFEKIIMVSKIFFFLPLLIRWGFKEARYICRLFLSFVDVLMLNFASLNRQNKQMKSYRPKWSNCDTMQRKCAGA